MLRLALEAAPNQLDPAMAVDVTEGELCALMFQGLVGFSVEGRVVPAAAARWRVEDGGRRFVFTLDRRMRFSDGSPVRVEDVVRSFERVLAPQSRSPRQWVLDRITGAREFGAGRADRIAGLDTPDDSTLVIRLREPFAPFLSMLALPAAMICRPAGDGDVPLGSGPWALAEWRRGDYVSLVPNSHHPGAAAALTEVRFRIITEAFTRMAEFENGALDVLQVPPIEVRRFLADESERGRLQSRPELRVYYVGLNNTRPPLDDVRVRRALNHAVNVDRLIDVFAGGEAVRATGSIPPTLAGYEEREAYRYDPDTARRLLAEAGYPDGFAMEIWLRESPQGNRVAEAVQGYLAEVGVEATLVRREWSAFKEAVSVGRVDAFLLDWFADYPDAENFLYPLFHSDNLGGGGNRSFFSDPGVDRLIERAAATVDEEERTHLYARIDSMLYDRAPWLYLYFPRTVHAVSPGVQGYRLPTLYLGYDFSDVRKTN